MKNYIFLLIIFLLAGCATARKNKKEGELINKIKTDKPFAEKAVITAITAYPDLSEQTTRIVHDTIVKDSTVYRMRFYPKYIVDTLSANHLIDSTLESIDSLQLLLTNRDQLTKVLRSSIMTLLKRGDLLSTDTLTVDTLGIITSSWSYKGVIYTVVNKKSEKIPYSSQVYKQTIQPADRPKWLEYWQSWLSSFLIVFLIAFIFKPSSK